MDTKHNPGKQEGFTLIGVLVGVIIISFVSALMSRALVRAEHITEVGKEQYVAASLAREGLELTRALRDTNWLQFEEAMQGEDFNEGQEEAARSSWVQSGLCEDDTEHDRWFTLDAAMVRNMEIGGEGVVVGGRQQEDADLYRLSSGEWAHDSTGQATPYSRMLAIDCTAINEEPSYVTITSSVRWTSRGQDRSLIVSEKLYNWKFVFEEIEEDEDEEDV